jgi:hypothetical protein
MFLTRVWPEMLFLAILHYKIGERPVQGRAQPEPGPKTEARRVPWDGRGQDFLRKNEFFAPPPGPCNAQV